MGTKESRQAPIDWAMVHRRLDAVRTAVDMAWRPDAETVARILRTRAQALARKPVAEQKADGLEIVEFLLAHERYGIETTLVREIFPLTSLTPLPCTPPFVAGIVNLRGEIVPVLEIGKFFDLPDRGLSDLNRVILLQSGAMRFGVLADAVSGVRRVPVRDIQPPLPTLTGIRGQYLKGVSSDRTIILDAEKLLADPKIVVQEQVEG
jgi:purine-binding chemotaxis protein CheW